jgi:hypothetical protein
MPWWATACPVGGSPGWCVCEGGGGGGGRLCANAGHTKAAWCTHRPRRCASCCCHTWLLLHALPQPSPAPPPLLAAWEDFARLPYLRMTVAESMRLYPQPPILIRRQAPAPLRTLRCSAARGPSAHSACLPPLLASCWPDTNRPPTWHNLSCRRPAGRLATTSCPPASTATRAATPSARGPTSSSRCGTCTGGRQRACEGCAPWCWDRRRGVGGEGGP